MLKKQGIEIDPLMIYIPVTTTIIKCPSSLSRSYNLTQFFSFVATKRVSCTIKPAMYGQSDP